MKKEIGKHPDTISGEAFIYEHGYKLVLEEHYYDPDFAKVKLLLPSVAGISDLRVFINKVKTDEQFAQSAVAELIDLWQANDELKPATGMILLAALWDKINQFKIKKPFVTFCEDIFFVLAGAGIDKDGKDIQSFSVQNHTDIIADLFEETNKY
jgi:hypothetical protein